MRCFCLVAMMVVACRSPALQIVRLEPSDMTAEAANMPKPGRSCPVTDKEPQTIQGFTCVEHSALEEEESCATKYNEVSLDRTLKKHNLARIERPKAVNERSGCGRSQGKQQLSSDAKVGEVVTLTDAGKDAFSGAAQAISTGKEQSAFVAVRDGVAFLVVPKRRQREVRKYNICKKCPDWQNPTVPPNVCKKSIASAAYVLAPGTAYGGVIELPYQVLEIGDAHKDWWDDKTAEEIKQAGCNCCPGPTLYPNTPDTP